MLELRPAPNQIIDWLRSEDAIDGIVAGTEQAHLIPKNAHGQRAGVLGVLSELGEILRYLPRSVEGLYYPQRLFVSKLASLDRIWSFSGVVNQILETALVSGGLRTHCKPPLQHCR